MVLYCLAHLPFLKMYSTRILIITSLHTKNEKHNLISVCFSCYWSVSHYCLVIPLWRWQDAQRPKVHGATILCAITILSVLHGNISRVCGINFKSSVINGLWTILRNSFGTELKNTSSLYYTRKMKHTESCVLHCRRRTQQTFLYFTCQSEIDLALSGL